jgi:hypothetical protein
LFADRFLKNNPHLSRDKSEIGRANWNLDRRQPVLYFIKEIRGPFLSGVNLCIVNPDCLDDIVPLFKSLEKLRDKSRRMLHITIHEDRRIAVAIIKTRD